ncbi:hypothetical protein C8Q77DRAFT_788121 [Trametes polyzona]|nr:hypothetical protein C8Q77DRAFT_788121 [Trametes polyzona]
MGVRGGCDRPGTAVDESEIYNIGRVGIRTRAMIDCNKHKLSRGHWPLASARAIISCCSGIARAIARGTRAGEGGIEREKPATESAFGRSTSGRRGRRHEGRPSSFDLFRAETFFASRWETGGGNGRRRLQQTGEGVESRRARRRGWGTNPYRAGPKGTDEGGPTDLDTRAHRSPSDAGRVQSSAAAPVSVAGDAATAPPPEAASNALGMRARARPGGRGREVMGKRRRREEGAGVGRTR